MDCRMALEELLEAEPDELAGEGDSPLAAHVRACARCREVAARLLEGQAELAGALAGLGPRAPVEGALAGARERGVEARRRHPRRWGALVPLAAAAALAGLLLLKGRDGLPPPTVPVAGVRPSIESLPVVESTLAKHVAVFETDDPRIVVVWFF